MSDEIARGGGVSAGMADVILSFKLGSGTELLQQILARRTCAARARREGLAASDEEIDEALDGFYTDHDLFEDPQRDAWRKAANLSLETLNAHFAEVVLARKLRVHLVPDAVIESHFKASRHDYSSAEVEIISFESEGAAAETALQLREGEIEWTAASSRAGGHDPQTVTRREAPEDIAAELFTAADGSFLGPVETEDGDFAIYRLLSKSEAELDDDLREEIRGRMFNEELAREFQKQPIQIIA